jgi:hypothetical protein
MRGRSRPPSSGARSRTSGWSPSCGGSWMRRPRPRPESTDGVIEPTDPGSPPSSSRSRRTWTRSTGTGSPSPGSARGGTSPGRSVTNIRSGKSLRLAEAQQFFGQEREAVEEAWPGDVVGLHDRGNLRIGDTSGLEGEPGVRGDSPLLAGALRPGAGARSPPRKHLDKGLLELSEEGAVQVFFQDGGRGRRRWWGRWAPSSSTCSCTGSSTSTRSRPGSTPCPTGMPGG